MPFQSTLTPQLPIPSSVSVQRGQSLMISDSVTLVTKDARYASTNLMLSVTCAQTAPIRCTKVSVQLDVPKTISRTIIIICAHSILKNLIIPLLQRTQWDALTVIFGTGSNKIALHVHMLAWHVKWMRTDVHHVPMAGIWQMQTSVNYEKHFGKDPWWKGQVGLALNR